MHRGLPQNRQHREGIIEKKIAEYSLFRIVVSSLLAQ